MNHEHCDTPYGHPQDDSIDTPSAVVAAPVIYHQELDAQKDEYQRLAADFDNFKKRTRRDAGEAAGAEKESFIRDLLPVLDNLERALACPQYISHDPFRQGVEMTRSQLVGLLQSHGIDIIGDVGGPFDHHRQEAVSMRHEPARPDHSVLEVIQRGYSRGDKLLRPARVIVNDLSPAGG